MTLRPVVGLTSYLEPARWGAWDMPAVLVPASYVKAIHAAGAAVVILPPFTGDLSTVAEFASASVSALDGLVIAGGVDVDPALYGQVPHETTDRPRVERDASEIAVYRAAREANLPVLGICRGLQVMAVAHGGSLHQHLPDLVGETTHRPAPGSYSNHPARFAADSIAATVVGSSDAVVNSSHHQAVDQPGDLKITGWAADGTVETVEDPSADFVLGVQWHPEVCADPAVGGKVFEAFVAACRARVASNA